MMKQAASSLFSLVRISGAAVLLFAAQSLQAHPGHDLSDQGALHVVTSPFHLATLALIGAFMLAGGAVVRRTPMRRALQGAGIVCLVLTVLLGLRA